MTTWPRALWQNLMLAEVHERRELFISWYMEKLTEWRWKDEGLSTE